MLLAQHQPNLEESGCPFILYIARGNMNKYLLFCSCIVCKKLTTVQSLNSHVNAHKPKANCLHCNSKLLSKKKFCNSSCAAKYNNKIVDRTKFKPGPKKRPGAKNVVPKYTKIGYCCVCNKLFVKKAKRQTCSKECLSAHISLKVRGKTGGNTDPNIQYIDPYGKLIFLDSTWELIMINEFEKNGVCWERPGRFILSSGRSYTPDFYLPEYNVFIDPKAKRKNHYRQSVEKICIFEAEYNTKCLIITSEKLLKWYHIQTMLLLGVTRS